jgi:hypothetical protein
MHGIKIVHSLALVDGNFSKEVDLSLAEIGSLEYRGIKKLQKLDLTGANVKRIEVTINAEKEWPRNLTALGFTYDQFIVTPTDDALKKQGLFTAWLGKMSEYTPQPYEQCAKILRQGGNSDKADEVLHAGKEKERETAWDNNEWAHWAKLWLQRMFVGYGIGSGCFWSLLWVLGFCLLGAFIVLPDCGKQEGIDRNIQEGKTTLRELCASSAPRTFLNCCAYSLDMLLPVIRLREKHYEIDLPGRKRYYFYLHRIFGWILGSFIIAGMSGLTQR